MIAEAGSCSRAEAMVKQSGEQVLDDLFAKKRGDAHPRKGRPRRPPKT